MRLTGKAKEQFERWFIGLPNSMGVNYGASDLTMNKFYCLPESMQWGVYQDWSDSVGYSLLTSPVDDLNSFYFELLAPDCMSPFFDASGGFHEFKTRQEARDAAIEKLNELINEK